MGRTRSVVEDSSKADKPNGMGDVVESLADSEAGQGQSPDLLPGLEWDKDANICQRMIMAQHEAKAIKPKLSGQKYNYLAHDDVTEEAKRVLNKNGVLFFPTIEKMQQDDRDQTNVIMTVRCTFINADRPEETIETISQSYGLDKQDKGPGKAYSYAVKFALQKALMLNTGEDIEEQSIEYTPADRAQKTEEDVKNWRREIFMQIKNTQSYETLKQIKTDNLPMLNSKIVPEETRSAITEKIDERLDELKQVLLQDEAAK